MPRKENPIYKGQGCLSEIPKQPPRDIYTVDHVLWVQLDTLTGTDFFRLNTLKGNTVILLRLNTVKCTKTAFLAPKRSSEHPDPLYMPPPAGPDPLYVPPPAGPHICPLPQVLIYAPPSRRSLYMPPPPAGPCICPLPQVLIYGPPLPQVLIYASPLLQVLKFLALLSWYRDWEQDNIN